MQSQSISWPHRAGLFARARNGTRSLSHADTYGKGRLSHPESLANDRNWLHDSNSATSYRVSSIVALVASINSVAILLL